MIERGTFDEINGNRSVGRGSRDSDPFDTHPLTKLPGHVHRGR